MPPIIEALIGQAKAAERAGRAAEAEAMWQEIAARAPAHPRVLLRRANQLLEGRDARAALDLLAPAAAADKTDPEIRLSQALAHRLLGDSANALAALDAALAIEPYNFLALLSKGAVLERLGHPRIAAMAYRDALKIAPPAETLPAGVQAGVARAKAMIAANAEALAAFLRQRTADLAARSAGEDLTRFEECLAIYAGTKKTYVHEPLLLNFPKLPAFTFYERSYFPWLAKLEAATDIFRAELELVLKADWERFRPYIQYAPGTPVNQWVALNHSPAWSTFFLWKNGTRNEENCQRCPRSAAALEGLSMAHIPEFSPTAMFSVLQPRTTIPAHTGSTNARLICHLPLILPSNCRFRVGNDTREWKMGEAFVFDDSIEHEAWNDSDEVRVVLIFDVWNPLLTQAERDLVSALLIARKEFDAGDLA